MCRIVEEGEKKRYAKKISLKQRYSTAKWQTKGIHTLDDLSKYYRESLPITTKLVDIAELGDGERKREFLKPFSSTQQERIHWHRSAGYVFATWIKFEWGRSTIGEQYLGEG